MKRFSLLLMFTLLNLAFFTVTAFAQSLVNNAAEEAETVTGQKFAFLVGISEYETFNNLQYTANDVSAFKDQLIESGFSPHNITVLASGARISLRPSKRNIEAEFDKMLKRIRAGDVIICMFAGHGIEVAGEPFFCPEDAAADSASNLQTTNISLNKIMTDLKQSEAKFKWMIVDACRDTPTRTASGTRSLGNIDTIPSGIVVLQSCASGQQSWEDAEFKHGVFTNFLIEGLRGKAADQDGIVSLLGLCQYATRRTQSHVKNRHQGEQLPYLKGELADFVLRSDLNSVEGGKLYREARELRFDKKYGEALEKIEAALQKVPNNRDFLDEKRTIEAFLLSTRQMFAFLVGVGDYASPTLSDLRYTVNDIDAFREQLIESGWQPHNIVTLTTKARSTYRPTKKNIENELTKMLRKLREGDVIVFMFTGHGAEDDGEQRFFPEDVVIDSADDLLTSSISLKQVMSDLEKSQAKFKWIIVDAARDTIMQQASSVEATNISVLPSGIVVLQSCKSGELTYEDDALKHGVFSHFLIEGLRGAAANTEGVVTPLNLYHFASRHTKQYTRQKFNYEQSPDLEGELGEFADFPIRSDVNERNERSPPIEKLPSESR